MSTQSLAGVAIGPETDAKLRAYADMLAQWNKTINLVSPQTLPELWQRHIADSAQVFALAPKARLWVDLGAGGGLPGVVCAIMAQELQPDCRFVLIESDKRKSTFLRSVARELAVPFTVIADRIEAVAPQGADIVSARALAPLAPLLALVHRHLAPNGVALLPKGKSYQSELETALQDWSFDMTAQPSQTSAESRILVIENITKSEAC